MDDHEVTSDEMLFEAVHRDRLDDLLILLKSSELDVNAHNSFHKTLLFVALEKQNVLMVHHLLDYGADINGQSYCCTYSTIESPIVTASRLHNMELVDMLITRGCSPSTETQVLQDVKTALQWAATHGDVALAERLVAIGEDVNWSGPYFHTALHYAVIANQPEILTWLLNHDADECVNGDGRTPLHIASAKGYYECACILIKRGHSVYQNDNYCFSAFTLACFRGHKLLLDLILHHIESCEGFQDQIDHGLRGAAEYGHIDVLKMLIKQNANIDSLNVYGESALSIASRGQNEAVQLLLDHGATINIVDKRGYLPLQHAIQTRHVDIALLLIYNGSIIQGPCPSTESPLRLAVNISNPLLVYYLIENGCNLEQEPWFNMNVIKEKSFEVDYKYPRNYHANSLQSRYKELWQAILDKIYRPPTLMEASRLTIRHCLVVSSVGKSIVRSVAQLPVPKVIQRYITVDYIDI